MVAIRDECERSIENTPVYNLCDTVVIKQPEAIEYCTVRLSELACYKSEYCCQAERIGLRGGPKVVLGPRGAPQAKPIPGG